VELLEWRIQALLADQYRKKRSVKRTRLQQVRAATNCGLTGGGRPSDIPEFRTARRRRLLAKALLKMMETKKAFCSKR